MCNGTPCLAWISLVAMFCIGLTSYQYYTDVFTKVGSFRLPIMDKWKFWVWTMTLVGLMDMATRLGHFWRWNIKAANKFQLWNRNCNKFVKNVRSQCAFGISWVLKTFVSIQWPIGLNYEILNFSLQRIDIDWFKGEIRLYAWISVYVRFFQLRYIRKTGISRCFRNVKPTKHFHYFSHRIPYGVNMSLVLIYTVPIFISEANLVLCYTKMADHVSISQLRFPLCVCFETTLHP